MTDIFSELRAQIRDQLRTTGTAQATTAELHMTTTEWRSVARAAARDLGHTADTYVEHGTVWARLRD